MSDIKTHGHIPMMEPETVQAVSISSKYGSTATATTPPSSSPSALTFEQRLRDIMEEWGFAIITDIFTPTECKQLESAFTRDLEGVCDVASCEGNSGNDGDVIDAQAPGFVKEPLKSWPTAMGNPFTLGKNTLCSSYGLIHGDFAWNIRRHDNVRRCWEAMYPGKDLCCGLDNIFFSTTPGEKKVPDEERKNPWWPHTDLNAYYKPSGDFDCYQGIVYVWSAESPDKSTTVVYPKSHKDVYDAHMLNNKDTFENKKGHFCQYPPETFEDLSQKMRRVPMPAGSMILFSSRTTHQGWRAGERLAMTVCWEPKERRDAAALERKINAVLTGIPTSHWASLGITHPSSDAPKDGGDATLRLRHRGHLGCLTKDVDDKTIVKADILACL